MWCERQSCPRLRFVYLSWRSSVGWAHKSPWLSCCCLAREVKHLFGIVSSSLQLSEGVRANAGGGLARPHFHRQCIQSLNEIMSLWVDRHRCHRAQRSKTIILQRFLPRRTIFFEDWPTGDYTTYEKVKRENFAALKSQFDKQQVQLSMFNLFYLIAQRKIASLKETISQNTFVGNEHTAQMAKQKKKALEDVRK